MATGVLYPTADHIAGDFSTGVHERADGQDVDPTEIRRQQLIDELTALGVEVPTGETPQERADRLLAELEGMDQSKAGDATGTGDQGATGDVIETPVMPAPTEPAPPAPGA